MFRAAFRVQNVRFAQLAFMFLAWALAASASAGPIRSGMQLTVNADDTVTINSMGSATFAGSVGSNAGSPFPFINGWGHTSGFTQWTDTNNTPTLRVDGSGVTVQNPGGIANSNGNIQTGGLVLNGSTALGAALRASNGVGTSPFSSTVANGSVAFTVSGTVTVAPLAGAAVDIQITVDDNVDPVIAGSGANNLTHTITARNLSGNPASGLAVNVSQILPADVTANAPVPSGTTSVSGENWTIGNLAAGASETLTITMTVGPNAIAGPVAQTAAIVSALTETDSESLNDRDSEFTTIQTEADLGIFAPAPAFAVAGTQTTYTIDVSNNGPSAATAVSVADPTPAGFTFASATAPCSGGFPCVLGDLAANDNVNFSVTYDVDPSTIGVVFTTATVSTSTTDPISGNDESSAFTVVSAEADLALTKTGPTDAIAGTQIDYDLTVTNTGPSDATDVAIADSLPTGVTFVSTSGCVEDPNGVPTCTVGTIPANGSAMVTITVDIDPDTTGAIVNTASVASDATDTNIGNDQDTATTNVSAEADVAIVKTGPTTALAGTQVTYTIDVSNNGPSAATAVSVADPTPAGFTFASATAPCAGGFPCSLGDLAANGNVSFNVTYDIDPSTTGGVTNTATVSTSTTDTNSNNDVSSIVTDVSAETDLSVVKTGPADAIAGTPVTYTITVTNTGPSDAVNVTVDDPTPFGFAFDSATAPCTGGFPCDLGTMAPNEVISIDVTFDIEASTLGDVTNTATVSTSTADPNSNNDASSVTTSVSGEADLAATKTGPATAVAGTQVTYTITVSNNGPSDAVNAFVDDPTPPGMTLVSASSPCDGGVFPCGLGRLEPNDVVSFDVTFDIDPSTLGDVTNTVTTGSQTTDPNSANDSASVTTIVSAEADLAITKTSDVSSVELGGTVVYTLFVENFGPSDATNVVITDNLPAEQVLVDSSGCAEDPNGAPSCTLGTLASGSSTTVTLTAQIRRPGAGFQRNTASVSSDVSDTVSANNEGSAGVIVVFAIPTLSRNGLLLMILLLAILGGLGLRRHL
jgi:uncharacterized repeat protein (TIGR01451 family)